MTSAARPAGVAAESDGGRRLRAAMFVLGDPTYDARVRREAASLAAAGVSVTVVAAPQRPGAPPVDDPGVRFVHVAPPSRRPLRAIALVSPWRLVGEAGRRLGGRPRAASVRDAAAAALLAVVVSPWLIVRLAATALPRLRGLPRRAGGLDWLAWWRWTVGPWSAAAAAAAPIADVYHAHDLTALGAAAAAARRHGGAVVYDSHEIFLASRRHAERPRWARRLVAARERALAQASEAVVTVNDACAAELERRLGPRRLVVVRNCPSRWTPPVPAPDLIRAAAGIAPTTAVVLCHGGFQPGRGLEETARAMLEPGLESAHLAFLGFGRLRDRLLELAADPAYGGRLHVLDAVPPAELLPWVASADVDVVAIAPTTLNHRLSTPNKLFESLAAGVPVVASDFPGIRAIVRPGHGDPLGELCDPTSPVAIARGVRAILELSPDARSAFRARCLAAAHERWNWETESARLVALYADLARSRGLPVPAAPPTAVP